MISLSKWVITVYILLSSETVIGTQYRMWILGAANEKGIRYEKTIFMNSCSLPLSEKYFETILTKEEMRELTSTERKMGDVSKNLFYACPVDWKNPNTWFEVDVQKMLLNEEGRLWFTYTKMLPVPESTFLPPSEPVQNKPQSFQTKEAPVAELWIAFISTVDPTKNFIGKYAVMLGNNGSSEVNSCDQNWSIRHNELFQETGKGTLMCAGMEFDVFLHHAVAGNQPTMGSEHWKRMHIENILNLSNGQDPANQVSHIDFYIFGREVWLRFDSKDPKHKGKRILCQGVLFEPTRVILAINPGTTLEYSNDFYVSKDQLDKNLPLCYQVKKEDIDIQRKFGLTSKQPNLRMWKTLELISHKNPFASFEKSLFIYYKSF